MSFKDLQYSFGKLTTKVKSQVAKNNPLQDHDSKGLNLWLFEERNHLALSKTLTYQHNETNKAFLSWLQEDVNKNKENTEYTQDIEEIGSTLYDLLCKQVELENEYNQRYIFYRRAIKSLREKEREMADIRDKRKALQERIEHLQQSNPTSKKIPELSAELEQVEPLDERQEMAFKRLVLREAFYLRFNAMQEYAEKLAMVAGYGKYIADLLDTENHARSNCEMIYKDAILSIDGWESQDKRETHVDLSFEEDEDAVLLTDQELKLQQEMLLASEGSGSAHDTTVKDSCIQSSAPSHPPGLSKKISFDYLALTEKKPTYRTYQEFQQQFGIHLQDSHPVDKKEPFDELPPPAYSNPEDVVPSEKKG